jgi:hypothetical protein
MPNFSTWTLEGLKKHMGDLSERLKGARGNNYNDLEVRGLKRLAAIKAAIEEKEAALGASGAAKAGPGDERGGRPGSGSNGRVGGRGGVGEETKWQAHRNIKTTLS